MICVLWALLKFSPRILLLLAIGAAACTAVSGVVYVLEGVRQLSASPSSSPSARQTL
jgi:hypothetical protein